MGRINYDLACEEFYKSYKLLSDSNKRLFSKLTNKLLNENFIYGQKDEDKDDYYNILNYKSIIENYFSMIDFDLVHDDTYKIFFIKTSADRNRIHLKKLDTVLLLIFRLLYYKSNLNVNSTTNITTSIDNLIVELNKTGIYKSQPTQTEFLNSFKILKRYKIIDYNFKEFKEDDIIKIFPTILYVVKTEDINILNNKISSYIAKQGDDDSETNED